MTRSISRFVSGVTCCRMCANRSIPVTSTWQMGQTVCNPSRPILRTFSMRFLMSSLITVSLTFYRLLWFAIVCHSVCHSVLIAFPYCYFTVTLLFLCCSYSVRYSLYASLCRVIYPFVHALADVGHRQKDGNLLTRWDCFSSTSVPCQAAYS